jgi:hypothetical protein
MLRAIAEGGGRIYFFEGDAWDRAIGIRVTATVTYLMTHRLVRAARPGNKTSYYLTAEGARVLGVVTDNTEESNSDQQ